MALPAGSRIGPYEIHSPIGAGGMGEVYRARDPRLGRDVAIKVLPPGWSADTERLQRFEQEARAAAALNHPNILAVYDIGQHSGSPYIVSELLEGDTLRERLTGGALPVRKAVDYAVQMARGLAAAHEKGIVHRDLKPENVFITNDGRLKILDFGLAKLTHADAAVAGSSAMATTPPNTQAGMVLGTLGYMSPEQVRGLPADHRSDLFAFGLVLYEMLSGRRAFERETGAETMTAILKEDPQDLPLVERHIPPALERIVDRCLEKVPAARFQSAGDLGFSLDSLSTHSESGAALASTTPVAGVSRFRRSLPWVAALVFLVATIVLAVVQFGRPQQIAPLVRFQVPPPMGGVFPGANNTPRIAISPDGQYLAFTVDLRDGTPDQLWIRRLDSLEARALPNTEGTAQGVQQPFWSPDSRHVAFFADGKLKRVDIASGGVQTIFSTPGITNPGGTWSRDGTILIGSASTKGLQRVSADGGAASQVTTLDESRNETAHLMPQFLPDGRHFLYFGFGDALEDRAVYAGAIGSAERTLVLESEHMAYFAPPDHLFLVRDGALIVQRFDVDALELQGDPVQIAEGVQGSATNGRVGVAVSDTGVLVYRPGAATAEADSELVWFDRAGKQLGAVGTPFSYRGVELSPDDLRVAVHREERQGAGDLWVLDLQRGSTARFTFDSTQHSLSPIWSPDGRRMFFSRNAGNSWGLYEKDSSGVGAETLLHQTRNFETLTPLSVSPDGQGLVFRVTNTLTRGDLLVLPLSGERKPSPYLQDPFDQVYGQLSPDGRWMAYASNESGRNDIYVQSFPSPGTRYVVSTAGGTQPRWRRDGKELFYLAQTPGFSSGDSTGMMSVNVEAAGAGLQFGIPEALFDSYAATVGPQTHTPVFQYSVSADGKRFLVAHRLTVGNANPAEVPLTVILNWTSALSAR